jgi:hypothetical protein
MIHIATGMQAGNEHLNLMSARGEKNDLPCTTGYLK